MLQPTIPGPDVLNRKKKLQREAAAFFLHRKRST
jgi:hypothetical protein